ncbi:hypothetical protein L6Q79_16020 [bacterium]|nr:hypothetical protein [bacterium]
MKGKFMRILSLLFLLISFELYSQVVDSTPIQYNAGLFPCFEYNGIKFSRNNYDAIAVISSKLRDNEIEKNIEVAKRYSKYNRILGAIGLASMFGGIYYNTRSNAKLGIAYPLMYGGAGLTITSNFTLGRSSHSYLEKAVDRYNVEIKK